MPTYQVELAGTITRDILWRELDAKDEAEARQICAAEMPTYRLRAISLRDSSAPCSPNTTSPNGSAGNSSTSSRRSVTGKR